MKYKNCNSLVKIIGRVLFAVPMVLFGLMHLMNAEQMVGLVPTYMLWPLFWVYFTGIALTLAGVSILINRLVAWSGILLGVMLLVFVLTLHVPQVLAGNQMAMPTMLKDLAIAGAAFYIASVCATSKMSKSQK